MKRFGKITIIGVGLIGGSIGLAIRNRHVAKEVVGVFRRGSTLKKALKVRAIDKGTLDIADGVKPFVTLASLEKGVAVKIAAHAAKAPKKAVKAKKAE